MIYYFIATASFYYVSGNRIIVSLTAKVLVYLFYFELVVQVLCKGDKIAGHEYNNRGILFRADFGDHLDTAQFERVRSLRDIGCRLTRRVQPSGPTGR